MNEEQIRDWVRRYGLHSTWRFAGHCCCTMDELDEAIKLELRMRLEDNCTRLIVTTGRGACPAGVYLPSPRRSVYEGGEWKLDKQPIQEVP